MSRDEELGRIALLDGREVVVRRKAPRKASLLELEQGGMQVLHLADRTGAVFQVLGVPAGVPVPQVGGYLRLAQGGEATYYKVLARNGALLVLEPAQVPGVVQRLHAARLGGG